MAAASVVATLLVLLVLWLINSDRPYPEAFRNLPKETRSIPAAVQEIATEAFPAGTPEKSLIATLSSWGFNFSYLEGQLTAQYMSGGLVCIDDLTISWTSDDQGRVVRVSTDIHQSCF